MPDSKRRDWIFRGNLVVPTGNPFDPKVVRDYNQRRASDDYLWLGPGLCILLDHVLTVREGIIRELVPSGIYVGDLDAEHVVRLDPRRDFLCPGCIDLHIHAPQYAFAGTATDRPLMGENGWLETYTFPTERRLSSDPALAHTVYSRVVRATLRHGTTTAVYFATLHLEPTKVLVDVASALGQRALIGKVCMDRHAPDNYCHSLQQNVDEAKEVIEYIHSKHGKLEELCVGGMQKPLSPQILPLVTPRFIPTCSPKLLSALGQLAQEYKCHITSHISESVDEVAFSRQLDETVDGDSGRTDAEIFDAHTLLTSRCIMAHGVHLNDKDLDLMRTTGSAIAHCPLSNFYFAGGSLPCRRILELDNKIGLGTDIAGGYHPSMWNSSRMAVVASLALEHEKTSLIAPTEPPGGQSSSSTAKQSEDGGGGSSHLLDYRHALYLATLGGARALGLEDTIGTLKVGMELDAIVLSAGPPIDIFDTDSTTDVFQKICVLGDDRNVKRVFVQGVDVTVV